jgi:hypothetical protein
MMADQNQIGDLKRKYAQKLSALKAKDKKNPNRALADNFQNEFENADTFAMWWLKQLREQGECCHYCGTPIAKIREFIDREALRTRNNRSKKDEKTGRSINGRGRELELECKSPDEGYSKSNCVLACMYCNNDKSDIFSEAEYKQFFGLNRRAYFLALERRFQQSKNSSSFAVGTNPAMTDGQAQK